MKHRCGDFHADAFCFAIWPDLFFENGKKRLPTFRGLRPAGGLFFGIQIDKKIYQFSEIKVSGCEKTNLIFFLGFSNNINVPCSFVSICVVMTSERYGLKPHLV